MVTAVIEAVYRFLWGDLFTIPLGNGNGIGIPLLVLLLIPTGVYFTLRTRFLPVRLFPDMIRALNGKKQEEGGLSPIQTLFVSTATRVGMGNLVGVVAAISAAVPVLCSGGGCRRRLGPPQRLWRPALAQLYKEKDPLYGGYHGGPAYYIHSYAERVRKKKLKRSVIAVLFALSGLICWGGISQSSATLWRRHLRMPLEFRRS